MPNEIIFLLLLFSAVFIFVIFSHLIAGKKRRAWIPVEALILDITRDKPNMSEYTAAQTRIKYEYQVGDDIYTGKKADKQFSSLIKGLQAGDTFEVYYDPKFPAKSHLFQGVHQEQVKLSAIILVIMWLAFGFIYFITHLELFFNLA